MDMKYEDLGNGFSVSYVDYPEFRSIFSAYFKQKNMARLYNGEFLPIRASLVDVPEIIDLPILVGQDKSGNNHIIGIRPR